MDVAIGAVKSGDSRPNSVWRPNGNLGAIEYLVRFIGLCPTDDEVRAVALARDMSEINTGAAASGASRSFRLCVEMSTPGCG